MIPGPCQLCGATNYELSMGGSTICPQCDCGNFPNPGLAVKRMMGLAPPPTTNERELASWSGFGVACSECGKTEVPFMVPPGWHHYSLRSERLRMWPHLCPTCGNFR